MRRQTFVSFTAIFLFVLGFSAPASAASFTLAWDPSAGATGYILQYGTQTGQYPNQIDVRNQVQYQVTGLNPATTYYFTVRAYNSSATSGPSLEISATTPAISNPLLSDINGDGYPDLLWQYQPTGAVGAWLMQGTSQIGAVSITPSTPSDPHWKVIAQVDFNRDNHADLLWRNESNGQLAVWYMNGATTLSISALNPNGFADLSWKVVAVADFNKDGFPDLLWRSDITGTFGVWYMQGPNLLSRAMLNPTSVGDLTWKVVGVADFDKDGYPDLLWRSDISGNFGVWFMQGVNLRATAMLNPLGVADVTWKVTAVVDFDGDGYPDLLWRNDLSGTFGVWYMQGINLRSMAMLNPTGMADLNWRVVAVR